MTPDSRRLQGMTAVSLRTKIAAGTAVLLGIISLVIFLYVPARQAKEFNAALQDKVETTVALLSEVVQAPLAFGVPEEVAQDLQLASRVDDLLYAVVLDTDGGVVAHTGDFNRYLDVSTEAPDGVVDGEVFQVRQRLFDPTGSHLGGLAVAFRLDRLNEQVAASRRNIAALAGMLFILGLGGAYWLSALIIGPLETIARTAKAIAAGDRAVRAPEDRRDELGLLAGAFNSMVEKLEGANAELESVNQSLEERVEERTRELQDEIVERRRVEEAQSLLAAAVDQAAEVHIIAAIDGTVEYANPAFERITGFAAEEVVGRPMGDLLTSENPADLMEDITTALLNGEGWTGVTHKRQRDDDGYTERTTISPVRDADGAITRLVSVGHDITREVGLEEQLRQAQKMEAVGRLAGGIAHDFNNLLTTVLGYTEMLLLEHGDNAQELTEIQRASERAAALTRQLLAFSRRQVMQAVPLSPSAIVEDMAGMLRRVIGEDIRLTVETDETDPHVRADKTQLEQVLLNLVLNSRDAMPDGGEVRIDVRRIQLDPENPDRMGKVQISVADDGHGMDDETLEQIFEPFFTTKEVGKGTGLGLSTVYGIVQQTGGDIRASSEPGKGTRIDILFDEVLGHSQPRTAEKPQAQSPVRGTVLVVEDEPMVRGLVCRQLEEAGMSVIMASSAEEALDLTDEYTGEIDGMLTDVIMPGMNGIELAALMTERRKGLRVLLMSGYTDRIEVKDESDAGGFPLLNKPFSKTQLLDALGTVLQ